MNAIYLFIHLHVTPVVSRRTSRGLVSAHNDARRRDGRPRDGEFTGSSHTRPRSRLLLHLLTILKSISHCLGLRSSKLGRLPNFL